MMKATTFQASTHSRQRSLPGGLLHLYQTPTPHTPVIPCLRPGKAREAQAFPGLVKNGQLPSRILRRRILRWARYPHPRIHSARRYMPRSSERSSHSLEFALSGASVPLTIVGRRHTGR
jgi:hypothetical protein